MFMRIVYYIETNDYDDYLVEVNIPVLSDEELEADKQSTIGERNAELV